jgi:hypothetical protein
MIIKPQVYIKFINNYDFEKTDQLGLIVKDKTDVFQRIKQHKFYDKPEAGRYPDTNPVYGFQLTISYSFDFLGTEMLKTLKSKYFCIGDIISKEKAKSYDNFEEDDWEEHEDYPVIRFPNGYMDRFGPGLRTLDPKTYAQIHPEIKTQKESEIDKFFAELKNSPSFKIQQLIQNVKK